MSLPTRGRRCKPPGENYLTDGQTIEDGRPWPAWFFGVGSEAGGRFGAAGIEPMGKPEAEIGEYALFGFCGT